MTIQGEKIRGAIRDLIEERGVDMATVSKAIGKNHAYIQQYLTRGVPAELSYKTITDLAEYFGGGLELFGLQKEAANSNAQARHPLQSIRRLVGLTPEQFARALGAKESEIRAIENGSKPLNEKMLLQVSRTFQIPPEDLAQYAPALSPEERVMLLRFRQLTTAQRRAIDDLFRKFERERA